VRCDNCGLLYVNNPPTDTEREKSYSFEEGYHSQLASAPETIAFHRAEAKKNLSMLDKQACKGTLLDIGCSTGLFLKNARESGWKVNGLEYSQDSAKVAREKFGLDVKQGELNSESYPRDSFDVVTMWDVIEHVPSPRRTLDLVREILSPNGLVVLKTPNADGLYPKASLKIAHRLDFWGHPEPPGHLFQFSAKTLSRLLDISGFDVIKVYHDRIPIRYSFGSPREWCRSMKWLAYCLGFVPIAMIGPWIQQGDDITIVARKRG
jgi:SAM-dependent methyltransferase